MPTRFDKFGPESGVDAVVVAAKFRDLLESVPDGIVMVNPLGRIVLANTQLERLFGYQPGELIGSSVEVLLPERLHAAHVQHRSSYFAQPRPRAMGAGLDLYGRRRDGSEFPVEISLSPLQMPEGTFAMSAVRDITERRCIERSLHEKNLELEKAAAAKNRFLATMSHELRTPLNAIIGFTGTLLMKLPGPLTPEQEKQLTTIQTSGRHLLSLINDLLDLARIESGRVELTLRAVSCQEVVAEVAATLEPLATKKGLAFDVRVPVEDVVVQSDHRTLSQIVINLANNAIKYTDHGQVVMTLERTALPGRWQTVIRVEDTGCGIRPEDQARLFQAFEQLDSASTRRYEGTGLGLHVSQRLASLLGGRIQFQSEFGRGSTFALVLDEEA